MTEQLPNKLVRARLAWRKAFDRSLPENERRKFAAIADRKWNSYLNEERNK